MKFKYLDNALNFSLISVIQEEPYLQKWHYTSYSYNENCHMFFVKEIYLN